MDQEECQSRRSKRTYTPPDVSGYFDAAIWPESRTHFDKYIKNRPGLKVFDGNQPLKHIWEESFQIIECRLKEKYALDDDKLIITDNFY